MPDMRTEAATDWLSAVRPAHLSDAWPPPVRPIENTAQATTLLVEFGLLLDQEADRAPDMLAALIFQKDTLEDLQHALGHLGGARSLSFFHWLRQTGLPNHLAIEKALLETDSPSGRALFATITTVAQQATLKRLISIERMEALMSATDNANKEPTNV
jgi:hypothetical protein